MDVGLASLHVSVIIFCVGLIVFSSVSCGFFFYNAFGSPYETLHGPQGLYLWNMISCKTCSHTHTHAHTCAHTHTHTHTHTHVGFYGLRGLSIGVMVFILYKLYVLLPYTYPTPKLSPHRRRCISIFPQKNSLCMIYKRFKLWGH